MDGGSKQRERETDTTRTHPTPSDTDRPPATAPIEPFVHRPHKRSHCTQCTQAVSETPCLTHRKQPHEPLAPLSLSLSLSVCVCDCWLGDDQSVLMHRSPLSLSQPPNHAHRQTDREGWMEGGREVSPHTHKSVSDPGQHGLPAKGPDAAERERKRHTAAHTTPHHMSSQSISHSTPSSPTHTQTHKHTDTHTQRCAVAVRSSL